METLKQKTARGLFWGGMNTMVQQVIGLLFGIILGRLLAPSDYGMMAIISVFSLVAVALQDSGFKVALANEKAPTHADYNAVFWFNILMGIALYAALFLSAPLIGRWYNTPQVVPLCRYAFLSIVVASMGTAQSTWLFKNLRAKQIAKASMAAITLSGCAGAAMALAGMAYWSLATQNVVYVALNTALLWHYSPWRPSVRGITFAPVRRMFRFSCKILASTVTTHINNNVLNILLGHYFSTADAGNFNQPTSGTSSATRSYRTWWGRWRSPCSWACAMTPAASWRPSASSCASRPSCRSRCSSASASWRTSSSSSP